MKIDGQCQCGEIRFEAEIDPAKVTICHCTDCQQLSGSPWRASVAVMPGDLHITHGKPATYIKTAESGNKRIQAFCGNCGSPFYSAPAGNMTFYGLRLGVVNQRAQLPPRRQIWTKSALPWASDIHGLPGREEG